MSKGAIREHQNQQGDAELDGLMEDISNMEQHMDNVARTPIAPSPTDMWFKGLHAPPMRQGKPVYVYATVVVKNISRVDVVNEMAYISFTVNLYWYDWRVPGMELAAAGGLPRDCVN